MRLILLFGEVVGWGEISNKEDGKGGRLLG